MATDSYHRVLMGKCCQHSCALIFDRIFFLSVDNEVNNGNLECVQIGQISLRTADVAALEPLKTSPYNYYWEIGVCPFTSLLFL